MQVAPTQPSALTPACTAAQHPRTCACSPRPFPQEFWKVSEGGSTARGQSDDENWVTFLGFTGDATMTTQTVKRDQRKLLFLGDSFTFGAGTMVGG
jgi:hypothetical protein